MKCPECKGRGRFLMPMSTPECGVCLGSGTAGAELAVRPQSPGGFLPITKCRQLSGELEHLSVLRQVARLR